MHEDPNKYEQRMIRLMDLSSAFVVGILIGMLITWMILT